MVIVSAVSMIFTLQLWNVPKRSFNFINNLKFVMNTREKTWTLNQLWLCSEFDPCCVTYYLGFALHFLVIYLSLYDHVEYWYHFTYIPFTVTIQVSDFHPPPLCFKSRLNFKAKNLISLVIIATQLFVLFGTYLNSSSTLTTC